MPPESLKWEGWPLTHSCIQAESSETPSEGRPTPTTATPSAPEILLFLCNLLATESLIKPTFDFSGLCFVLFLRLFVTWFHWILTALEGKVSNTGVPTHLAPEGGQETHPNPHMSGGKSKTGSHRGGVPTHEVVVPYTPTPEAPPSAFTPSFYLCVKLYFSRELWFSHPGTNYRVPVALSDFLFLCHIGQVPWLPSYKTPLLSGQHNQVRSSSCWYAFPSIRAVTLSSLCSSPCSVTNFKLLPW